MQRNRLSHLIAAALCAGTVAHAETCVPVEVQNVRPGQGSLLVAAYGRADDFNKTATAQMRLRAGEATMKLQVCVPEGKAIALMLFQDVNDNGKLDANLLGIPSEPWGSSSAAGAPARFGAPTWDSAQVRLDGSAVVVKLSR